MDTKVYNGVVISLKEKINKLEEDILNGNRTVETLTDFNNVFYLVKTILAEYSAIYAELPGEVSKSRFLSLYEEENEFLLILCNLLNNLSHYHKVLSNGPVTYISKEEMMLEWESVKSILLYNKIRGDMSTLVRNWAEVSTRDDMEEINDKTEFDQLIEMNEILKKHETVKNEAEEYIDQLGEAEERVVTDGSVNHFKKNNDEIREEYARKTEEEALKAVHRFVEQYDDIYDREETVAEDFYKELVLRDDDIRVDFSYLDSLSFLYQKIDYITLVLKNIEKLPGRKITVKHANAKKKVAKKYASRWLRYYSELGSLIKEERDQIEAEERQYLEEIELAAKKEYSNYVVQFRDAEEELFRLANQANDYLKTNKVVAAASFKGEPFYVLKTDLNEFSQVFMKYKRLQREIQNCGKKNNIEISMDIERFEETEIRSYQEMLFLERQGKNAETVEKIKEVKEQFAHACKSKAFSIYAELKAMHHKLAIPKDKSEMLIKIIENPEKFLRSINSTIAEKKNCFDTILANMDEYVEKIKGKNLEKITGKSKVIIGNVKEKINKCVGLLPKKEEVSKIINIKNASNKKKLIAGIVGISVSATLLCGISAISEKSSLAKDRDKNMNVEATLPESLNDFSIDIENLDNISAAAKAENVIEQDTKSLDEVNVGSTVDIKEQASKVEVKPAAVTTSEEESIEKEINDDMQEITSETKDNDNYHDFGDILTVQKGTQIYGSYNDAAKNENGKTPYFNAESLRTVYGITYEYNGEIIFISDKDEDAAYKRAALIANGAKEVNYLVRNENNPDSPFYEGFYADEDVVFENNGNGLVR